MEQMNDEDSVSDTLVLGRLSMNTRLSAARIFDEESNDSAKSDPKSESKAGKMKTLKNNVKKSPYKTNLSRKNIEYETDPEVLERRQKQIDYGKNTVCYDNYRKLVPKHKRSKDHPRTPVKYMKYSRRGWDGLIKIWKQKLHEFEPETEDMKTEEEDSKPVLVEIKIKKEVEEPEKNGGSFKTQNELMKTWKQELNEFESNHKNVKVKTEVKEEVESGEEESENGDEDFRTNDDQPKLRDFI